MVLENNEEKGGYHIDISTTIRFKKTIDSYNLNDIGYKGTKFTWANNHIDNTFILGRLDIFLVSDTWFENYQFFSNKHLLWYASNNYHIILWYKIDSRCRDCRNKTTRMLKFEKIWTIEEDNYWIILNCWNSDTADYKTN